jgi:hypothetical protein
MEHPAFKPLMIRQSSLTRLGSMLNTAVGNSKKPGETIILMTPPPIFLINNYRAFRRS